MSLQLEHIQMMLLILQVLQMLPLREIENSLLELVHQQAKERMQSLYLIMGIH